MREQALSRLELPDRARRVIVWLLVVLYAGFFSAFTIARHEAFESGAFDLGFMDQAAWNTLRGHIMGVSIELWTASTHLGYHFDPILILVSPAYLVYSSPNSLLVVQSVALALGALPASWLARRRLGSNWAAIALALAYLLYPGLEAANVYDFHGFALSAPLILVCFYLIETERLGWFAVAAVLTNATKENTPLTTAMLGLYLVVARRRVGAGAATFLVSVGWFLAATYVAIPSFNAEGQSWLWHRFGGMGGTPLQIVGFLLENPRRLIEPAPGLSNLSYLAKLLFPLGFLSPLDPLSFLVAAPGLATNLLTVYEPMHLLETYHYTASLVPVVVVSAIYGAERAIRLASWLLGRVAGARAALTPTLSREEREAGQGVRSGPHLLFVALVSVGVLACSLAYHYYRGYTPISPSFAWPQVAEHQAVGRRIAASIPPEAAVSAQSNLYPHVSQRKMVWMFPYVGPADYIFLDVASQPNSVGLNDDFHRILRDALERSDFGPVVAEDGYLLVKRGAPHRELPDGFFDFARAPAPAPRYRLDARFGDAVRLIGFDLQTGRDATANLTLYWQPLRRLDRDLFFPVYLTDGRGHEQGATLYRQPADVWYPTTAWRPGETVRIQTLNLPWDPRGRDFGLAVGVVDGGDPWDVGRRLRPSLESASWVTLAPGGGTLLEIVTFRNDRGLIRPEFRPRAQDATSPAVEAQATLGGAARLVGYDLTPSPARAGQPVRLVLHWRAVGQLDRDNTVFAHVLDGQNRVVAQRDSPPLAGLAPTSLWLPGDTLADEYLIDLPAALPAGEYRLEVGMYDPESGQRLPAVGAGGRQTDAIVLGQPLVVERR